MEMIWRQKDTVRKRIEVESLTFSPDGRTLIVGFNDSVIASLGYSDSSVDAVLGYEDETQLRSSKVGKQQPQEFPSDYGEYGMVVSPYLRSQS